MEYIKEFSILDGLGAQILRKIYAASYAKYYNLPFQDTPITDFLVHESDKIKTDDQKRKLINDIFSLIEIPNDDVSGMDLCPLVGAGRLENQGLLSGGSVEFLNTASQFNKVNETDNNVVIHIRRGNLSPNNPRWISDEVYINLLNNLPELLDKLDIKPDRVIILSDGTDSHKIYKPDGQHESWDQLFLYGKEQLISPIKKNKLISVYPNLEILNNLDTYEAFLLMLKAKLLITSKSAFSLSAGLLSKNLVISVIGSAFYPDKFIGFFDESGNINMQNS